MASTRRRSPLPGNWHTEIVAIKPDDVSEPVTVGKLNVKGLEVELIG